MHQSYHQLNSLVATTDQPIHAPKDFGTVPYVFLSILVLSFVLLLRFSSAFVNFFTILIPSTALSTFLLALILSVIQKGPSSSSPKIKCCTSPGFKVHA
jgi:hypothetical protein